MASYSTIPEEELVERPKQKTSLTRLVATSALLSFALGACAAALIYDGAKWVCNWGHDDTPWKDNYDCSDGCTTSGIHRACQEPQRPQFLFGEWRCAWPGWQEESPGP